MDDLVTIPSGTSRLPVFQEIEWRVGTRTRALMLAQGMDISLPLRALGISYFV
jgi:hypothetical protein